MPKATQLVLALSSRPGVLAKVASTLAAARVNIIAVSTGGTGRRGRIRLLVNDVARARRALKTAGYRPTEETAFVLRLRNRPGALARVAQRVARAGVNITAAYATTAGSGGARVVLTVPNTAKARRAFR